MMSWSSLASLRDATAMMRTLEGDNRGNCCIGGRAGGTDDLWFDSDRLTSGRDRPTTAATWNLVPPLYSPIQPCTLTRCHQQPEQDVQNSRRNGGTTMPHTSAGARLQTATSVQNDENWMLQETTYPQEDIPRPGSEALQALGRPTRGCSSRCVLAPGLLAN